MLFTYNVNDPHDKVESIVEAVHDSALPDVRRSEAFAAQIRQHHWDTRRITSHGTYFGGPDYQWLAHIPGKLVTLLDMRHPGWDTDERTMRKILALYPQTKVLPEDTSR